MTSIDQKYYRDIYNSTRQAMKAGEQYLEELTASAPSTVRDKLLESTERHLQNLRAEADELEKLGWPESFK